MSLGEREDFFDIFGRNLGESIPEPLLRKAKPAQVGKLQRMDHLAKQQLSILKNGFGLGSGGEAKPAFPQGPVAGDTLLGGGNCAKDPSLLSGQQLVQSSQLRSCRRRIGRASRLASLERSS